MGKRKFSAVERYAVWTCHGRRCWFCLEPLGLDATTVDHFLPESLLDDDELRARVLEQYGLDENFHINSFSNWLPCHARCNQRKAANVLRWSAASELVLEELIKRAPKIEELARRVSQVERRGEIEGAVLSALEGGVLSPQDLRSLLERVDLEAATPVLPGDVVLLDNQCWVHRSEIAREGFCTCDRDTCVGHNERVYCYFTPDLSPWVIHSGLYWRCYDEVIQCPRCGGRHKRGHVGKMGSCYRPFRNQGMQMD